MKNGSRSNGYPKRCVDGPKFTGSNEMPIGKMLCRNVWLRRGPTRKPKSCSQNWSSAAFS
eukprot:scaffold5135_cov166-Amphora_coffeaeformis.AAC.1